MPTAPGASVEGVGVGAALGQHGPHVELAGARPGQRLVAVDEEELVHAVGRRGEEVAPEAEQVAVAGVEAGDGAAAHLLHLVRHGHARDGGPADVVVGNEERGGDRAQHADLVPHPGQVRGGGRLDFADQLERPAPSCAALTSSCVKRKPDGRRCRASTRCQPVDS